MKYVSHLLIIGFLALQGLAARPPAAAFQTVLADPIWCPAGVTPNSGVGGCSPSFGSLSALLTWLGAHDPDQSGVIWLAKTFDSAGEGVSGFTLDGAHLTHMRNHALTIQGGWNGLGTSSVDHSDRSVFSGDFLHIDHWRAAVTVNDVLVDGPAAVGLSVNTTGNIAVADADFQNSVGGAGNGDGAVLFNYAGRGTVMLRNASFNHNAEDGLLVNSAGAIWLNGVTANNNGANFVGASVDNRSAASAQAVILLGSNTFNGNGAGGLDVFSKGAIATQGSITANNNGLTGGVYLDNTSAASSQPVSVLGPLHTFHGNGQAGLVVNSHGAISAQHLDAQGNTQWGAVLNNSGSGGAGSVIVSGWSNFLNNGSSGMNVFSNGDISVFEIVTIGNAGDGLMLGTPYHANVYCAKDYSNGGYGVNAGTVGGPLTLSDMTFDGGINALGDYSYPGTAALTTGGCALASGLSSGGTPMRIVRYTPGSSLALDCNKYGSTHLVLLDGRVVTLDCPTYGGVVVRTKGLAGLPSPLPKGDGFVSGLKLLVQQKNVPQSLTAGLSVLSFVLPANLKGKNFAILYWDGKSWIELRQAVFQDGRVVFDGGTQSAAHVFAARVNFTGLFVLATVP
jgi:hypothetical protein